MVHPVDNCGFARAYIVSCPEGLMVVDVGSVGAAGDVAAYIQGPLGRSLGDVRYITATHFHVDHIGGIGRLLRQCGADTKVLFHRFVEGYLAGERALPRMKNWFTGLLPALVRSSRSVRSLSHLLVESAAGFPLPLLRSRSVLPYARDRIAFFGAGRSTIGFDGWEAIETPGHTEDSITLYRGSSGDLICGDLILNLDDGGMGGLNRFYGDRESLIGSYRLLCRTTRPTALYPGHGDVIKGDGDLLARIKLL